MEIKIQKKFIRMSPDKIRPVVNLVRGWKIEKAMTKLTFLRKRAGIPVLETLKSAFAAIKDKDTEIGDAYIKSIICNEGPRLKRRRIIHRGRATAINKRMSHIIMIVADKNDNKTEADKTKRDKKNNTSNKTDAKLDSSKNNVSPKISRRQNGSKG